MFQSLITRFFFNVSNWTLEGHSHQRFAASGFVLLASMASLQQILHVLYQWQWLPLLTVLFITYTIYYLFHVVQKPRLIGKEGRLRQFILQSCPIVSEQYWPTFWCFGARAQTVIRALLRSKPSVPYRR